MGKRKNPDTSQAAYASLDIVKIHKTHMAIARALEALGKGNYESIANYLNEPEQKIWKRINECIKAKLIHDTGERTMTKSGHPCRVYAPGPATKEAEHKKRVMKGKSIPEFAKAINQVKPSPNTIERFF